jgi:hypothetical protein
VVGFKMHASVMHQIQHARHAVEDDQQQHMPYIKVSQQWQPIQISR